MKAKRLEKNIIKIPERKSVSIWTENTGTKAANEKVWDKAVRESNKKHSNILDPKDDNK